PLSAPRSPSRTSLSWWTLLFMEPQLPDDAAAWAPASMLLDTQGLAILRTRERYVSLECGPSGGGHGHPDRLHLTLHADGVHWLPDLGTGSYVAHDLFWYRSTLAHNAPRLDGRSQPPGDAHCLAFYVLRARGRGARFVTVLEPVAAAPTVRGVRARGEVVDVETARGIERHAIGAEGWEVQVGAERVRLSGTRPTVPALQPLLELERPTPVTGTALRVDRPPALDGTLDGFDLAEPLRLDLEDQYRRSEEPYAGPEEF